MAVTADAGCSSVHLGVRTAARPLAGTSRAEVDDPPSGGTISRWRLLEASCTFADRIALLSNNPDKAAQLQRLGVEVSERVPTAVHLLTANARYLTAKVVRTAHTLDLPFAG